MTFTLQDLLLLLIAGAALYLAWQLGQTARQVRRTAAEAEGALRELRSLTPRVSQLIDKADAAVEDLAEVSASAARVSGRFEEMTDAAREAVAPVIAAVHQLAAPVQRAAALWSGVQAALGFFMRHRTDGDETLPEEEKEEENGQA